MLSSSNSDPKRIVKYRADKPWRAQVGMSGFCYPLDHPSEDVTGDGNTPAMTSMVTAVNVITGEFWTRNTHYVPEWLSGFGV